MTGNISSISARMLLYILLGVNLAFGQNAEEAPIVEYGKSLSASLQFSENALVGSCEFDVNGRRLVILISSNDEKGSRMTVVDGGTQVSEFYSPVVTGPLVSVGISPDGNELGVASVDSGTMQVRILSIPRKALIVDESVKLWMATRSYGKKNTSRVNCRFVSGNWPLPTGSPEKTMRRGLIFSVNSEAGVLVGSVCRDENDRFSRVLMHRSARKTIDQYDAEYSSNNILVNVLFLSQDAVYLDPAFYFVKN